MATFMDTENYEQVSVPREVIGDPADFLADGMMCNVTMYEGTALSVELPPTVTLEVVEADPVVRGQTASSSYKPGRLENGRRVMIPPHIGAGTRIVVSTADGSYMERAKD
jgi:elongation factor P